MTKLSDMVKQGRFQQVKVRNGHEWTFKSAHNLVPGDVILIHTNQILPADCVLLSGEVLVNESTLTGEAAAMAKDRDSNLLTECLEFHLFWQFKYPPVRQV